MLRVAYLFERFPSFGQTFCYREVAELIRQGAEVTIFALRQAKNEPAQDWDPRVVERVIHLPEEGPLLAEIERATRQRKLPARVVSELKNWGRQSDFLRLYQAAFVGLRLQEAGITRVHAHFAGMAARTAYWIKEFFGIDFSVTAHANDIFAPRDFVVSLEKIMDGAVAIVTVSDFAVRQLAERFPQNASKTHRVYNGIDPTQFSAADFSSAPPVIISVGRLIEKKGFTHLIAACAALRKMQVPFRCEIIGEGPLAASLAEQIEREGLRSVVELLGPRPQREIMQRLARANVFLLACGADAKGDMDNLPTVIMEAMAAGLPVVSTPLAGVPEMVHAGETGELVRCDGEALAAATAPLLRDPALARRFGEAGRRIAEEKFSIAANARRLAEILGSA